MALILVEHDTSVPALYGAAAAAVAYERNCAIAHLPAVFDTDRHADAVQHVLSGGGLGPSGLCWYERLNAGAAPASSTPEEIVAAARASDVVVPLHPAFLADQGAGARLVGLAGQGDVGVDTVAAIVTGAVLADRANGRALAWQDRFGRIMPDPPGETATAQPLRIGLVGAEADHQEVYPAALASLADAADFLSLDLSIHFIDPVAARPDNLGDYGRLSGRHRKLNWHEATPAGCGSVAHARAIFAQRFIASARSSR